MAHGEERPFRPAALTPSDLKRLIDRVISKQDSGPLELCRSLREMAKQAEKKFQEDHVQDHLALAVATSLLADLCEQEWRIRVRNNEIVIAPPDWTHASGHESDRIKSRIRNGLQIASDRQIATEAVQSFLRSMERNRVFDGRIVSIETLVDSGRELSERLRALTAALKLERDKALEKIIDPYLQICEEGASCAFTGLALIDVWRYFRHTWSLEYNPLPGRTLRFLVRNKSRPNHPIIGIAMLASPATNMYIRDEWIGWRLDDVISGLASGALDPAKVGKTLWSTMTAAISEIRSDDLISAEELNNPTNETFFKLRQIAGLAYRQRREDLSQQLEGDEIDEERIVDIRTFRKRRLGMPDWRTLSETPLFVKKRAEQLIPLLRAHSFMKKADFDTLPAAAVYETLISRKGRAVLVFALNELRKRKLATELVDLAVCGAIAPYNYLLGGKLVTLLMASEDARRMYAERYGDQQSEIASQMAGRPIVRPSDLCVVTTTSLYGIASSQYNRLKVEARERVSLPARSLEWKYLGRTEGVTITHLSSRTVKLMQALGERKYNARRINSVFGEGSSPRTRQIREGLNLIGINDESVLKQSIGRRVYASEMIPAGREALTGFGGRKPKKSGLSCRAISRAWIQRWLSNRILSIDVLEQVRQIETKWISMTFRERALRGAIEAQTDLTNELQLNLLLGERIAPIKTAQ